MANPLVSVVITTKNEEKNIENCIRSILLQTYKETEVIVVDNGSTDGTKEIARKYTALVFDKGPERSAQRNLGMIEKSNGQYVMFVDADMIFSPGLVSAAVRHMSEHAGKFNSLHISEVVLGKKYWSKVRRFERGFYDGTVIDGARFFLKDAFVNAGGFDENMSGPEDWDIDKKMKETGSIGMVPADRKLRASLAEWDAAFAGFLRERGVNPDKYGNVIFHNESEFILSKYLAKKGYYAESFNNYVTKWGRNDPDVKKQLGIGYRYFGVFLEKGKWLRLLTHPLLTFGMYLLRFLVGLKYLGRKRG